MSEPKDVEVPCLRCNGTGMVTITESALRRRDWKLKQKDVASTSHYGKTPVKGNPHA